MASAGLIDPTKTGKYPVILGDGLLGKTSNEIFTGIQYNHKPTLSSNSAPNQARLKPSVPGKTTSYDLTYKDNDDAYAFAGTRNTDGNQYVLYFDPDRKAFVLDKVDSTFNMNVTRLPDNSDPGSLSRQYPHIDTNTPPSNTSKPTKSTTEQEKPAPKPRALTQKKEIKRKQEKKQPSKTVELSLPKPEPAKPAKPEPKRSAPQPEEEDEDEDDDGGLLVEYPGVKPTGIQQTDFSPAFPSVRRFDDFMNQRESEGDDADGEDDDEPDIDFKLPSPVNHHAQEPQPMDIDKDEGDGGADLEDDLEKDLEMAFEDVENSAQGSPDGDESEISEED